MDKEAVNRLTGHHPDYDTDLIYQHITPLDGGTLALIDRLEILVESEVEFQTEEVFQSRNQHKNFVLQASDVQLMLPVERTVGKAFNHLKKRALPATCLPNQVSGSAKRSKGRAHRGSVFAQCVLQKG